MEYPKSEVKYRFYGTNVELMIEKCLGMPEGEEKQKYLDILVSYMKMSYRLWNDDKVADELILKHLKELSGYRLEAQSIPDFIMPIEKSPPKEQKKGKSNKNYKKRKTNRSY